MMHSADLEAPPAVASELERFVDAMMDEHLGVMVEIVGLEREAKSVVVAGRAGAVVGRVVRDLCAVRDAAAGVVLDATRPTLGPLFEPGAPLGVYLTGLLMWSRGVARAMRRMVRSTRDGQPAWLKTRQRLQAAKGTYLRGLGDDSLSHVEELCRGAPSVAGAIGFQRELRGLVAAAERLGRTLRESFTVTPAV